MFILWSNASKYRSPFREITFWFLLCCCHISPWIFGKLLYLTWIQILKLAKSMNWELNSPIKKNKSSIHLTSSPAVILSLSSSHSSFSKYCLNSQSPIPHLSSPSQHILVTCIFLIPSRLYWLLRSLWRICHLKCSNPNGINLHLISLNNVLYFSTLIY